MMTNTKKFASQDGGAGRAMMAHFRLKELLCLAPMECGTGSRPQPTKATRSLLEGAQSNQWAGKHLRKREGESQSESSFIDKRPVQFLVALSLAVPYACSLPSLCLVRLSLVGSSEQGLLPDSGPFGWEGQQLSNLVSLSSRH